MGELKVEQLTRQFKYQGLTLPDPGPGVSAEAVKTLYSNTYPELANASIDGPKMKGSTMLYEFVRAVRDKG